MAAQIRIIMKSFMSQANKVQGVIPYAQKIGLPESRSLYTVLRSPHIDKKSREQFSMHVKKQFLVQKAETHELQKKLFWLKRLRLLGAQYEIQISFKTRLDKMLDHVDTVYNPCLDGTDLQCLMLPRKINNYVGSFETGNVVRTSLSLIQPYLVYSKDQLFELKHNNSIIRNIEHEQGGRRSSHGMNK
uniref:Small ribosomal subunit protein uS10 domain-containing protein n=1 Tax=Oryza glaberrima TaxID=4538 RepID=I1Q2V2_ORYGL